MSATPSEATKVLDRHEPAHLADAKPPVLSIVISCHNYEDYVAEAISSVTSQQRDDCELVVVDDGSEDHSWDTIKTFPVRAFRIENGGQTRACAYGLSKTSAPFVMLLDADDQLKPGSLSKIIAALDPNVAKLQFPLTRIDTDGKIISAALPPLGDFRDTGAIADQVLKYGAYTTPPTSGNVFRRDVCNHLYEVDYETTADGVILFAAPFCGDIVSLSEELGLYRVHRRNQSGVGSSLNPSILKRDIVRYVKRLDHLRRLIGPRGKELVVPEQTYFFLERSFTYDIATGHRPSLARVQALLKSLWRHPFQLPLKVGMTAFFVMTACFPNRQALRAITYRYHPGHRSVSGLVKAIATG